MMTIRILISIMAVLLFIGWSSNPVVNTQVCAVDHEQKKPQLASDGAGGAVIVWEDTRSGGDYDIYAQYIDPTGTPKWTKGGIAICSLVGQQRSPMITADSSGGFIITWYDQRNGKNYDIYAQRIDSTGKILWDTNGAAICTADDNQFDPIPAPDGGGGAFITWQDRRNGKDYDVYAQRIDASGKTRWSGNGIIICGAKDSQENPQPVSDGKGGAIITWQDRRNGTDYDIYAQRIDGAGTAIWAANGAAVCGAENDQRGPQLISDGTGSAVITWMDKRNGTDYKIYTQRIGASGITQWTANGIAICDAVNSQYDPRLVPDGKGGAIITWQDYRKGGECSFDAFAQQANVKSEICSEKQLHDWIICAQLIDSSGKIKWAASGVEICKANSDQYKPQPVSDGNGGAIIVWRAADKENDFNIYAQRLSPTGALKWSPNGVALCKAPREQYDPTVVSDGKGGAVATWYDKRKNADFDIYAQTICASGIIGNCR